MIKVLVIALLLGVFVENYAGSFVAPTGDHPVTMAYLSRRWPDREQGMKAVEKYASINGQMRPGDDFSVKVSQFGTVDVAVEVCSRVGERHIWVDAEELEHLPMQREAYFAMKERCASVAITVQACHAQQAEETLSMLSSGDQVRFVKGYFNDCTEKNWDTLNENYEKLVKIGIEKGLKRVAIASHHSELVHGLVAGLTPEQLGRVEVQGMAVFTLSVVDWARDRGINTHVYQGFGEILYLVQLLPAIDYSRLPLVYHFRRWYDG